MSDSLLIEAARSGDLEQLQARLGIEDVNTTDENGWSALNWAAGAGNADMVSVLLEHGADPNQTGADERTPYMIALAAGRKEVATILREKTGTESRHTFATSDRMPYCKAYPIRELEAYSAWTPKISADMPSDKSEPQSSDTGIENIVFIHHDYTVTKSMWHDEDVIFDSVDTEWIDFCTNSLQFKVPDDFDLTLENDPSS